jgi:hypothetical protein
MKVDAHPLLVAVALGLLGPAVLEADDDRDDSDASSMFKIADEAETPAWEPGPAPDPEEFHRVELEWNGAFGASSEWLKTTR